MEHFQDVLTLPTPSDQGMAISHECERREQLPRPAAESKRTPTRKGARAGGVTSEGSEVPIGSVTSDISLGGCYIEMMFTLAKDTKLDITITIDGTLLALGTVVTCDPNVGNGVKFTKMLPEDQEELRCYLEAAQDASESPT